MLHEVAYLLGIAFGAKAGIELSCQLIYVVPNVVNFGAQLSQFLRWAGFQLGSLNQPPQVSGLAEPAGFGILPELLRLLPVQAQADFVVLRFGSSFLPPVGGIGVRVLPASGAKDIFARCLRILAAGERELRRWAQYLCLFPSNLIHIMIHIASPFRFNLMCAGAHNVQKTGWLMCIRVHNQPAGIWGHSCCSL